MPKFMEGNPAENFWEGPYPEHQAQLADEKIQKMAEALKRDGYHFELTEDASEYVLRTEGFKGITHITKVNDPEHVDIKAIIIDRVMHPEDASEKT
jgi:hypothetical protein